VGVRPQHFSKLCVARAAAFTGRNKARAQHHQHESSSFSCPFLLMIAPVNDNFALPRASSSPLPFSLLYKWARASHPTAARRFVQFNYSAAPTST
jgi:hypothetical protein